MSNGMDRQTVGSTPRGRLRVDVRNEGSSAVVTPAGELDHHTADLLREPLEEAVSQGRARLVVDCSQLEFCDSTGSTSCSAPASRRRPPGAGSISPRCGRWSHASSRSPGPRRSSPSTTPSSRPSPTDPPGLLRRRDQDLSHSCAAVTDALPVSQAGREIRGCSHGHFGQERPWTRRSDQRARARTPYKFLLCSAGSTRHIVELANR